MEVLLWYLGVLAVTLSAVLLSIFAVAKSRGGLIGSLAVTVLLVVFLGIAIVMTKIYF